MKRRLENFLFGHRRAVLGAFLVVTVLMGLSATRLRVDAGFTKLLPVHHEYMQAFTQYREEFGGANRILIALIAKDGDIFTPRFFNTLKAATDEVFFIPGVDRTRVSSLFTPNVRFTEVVEDGIAGGNVIPADFRPTPEGLDQVRRNILKAGILGRLVANDFSGALVSAQLLETDPATGEKLDYIGVAGILEEKIRKRFQSEDIGVETGVHIIGFAKIIGDIAQGAARVIGFFVVAVTITFLLVYIYSKSLRITLLAVICSLTAVIWQLGLLPLLGFGLDPMSILVPFLIFAIGVSHGVQMISAVGAEIYDGADALSAARASFRRLLVPGGVALVSDTVGFITILLIRIQVIREVAITASLGVASIIFTNLVLLPLLLSHVAGYESLRRKLQRRSSRMTPLWSHVAAVAERPTALYILLAAVVLLFVGVRKGTSVKIGDLHRGVPELHADSRYNLDSEVICERFSIGVDLLTVIVETPPDGCIDYEVMALIDRFGWHMRNVPGVQSVISLADVAKRINAGWNEGSLKWHILPRNPQVLAQAVAPVPTASGLLNADSSALPVLIFTTDHKAETIDTIIDEVKSFRQAHGTNKVRFRLASGNVGVMAATNEAVQAAQFPMVIYVYAAIIALTLLTFRSVRALLCIILPLGLVSLLAYALMSWLEIGLKVNTLPVVALGVGIGVDYGIYMFSRLLSVLPQTTCLRDAYRKTLEMTGNGVVFTGITLAIGVATWMFSPLKFQADMGILLTFMFLMNMLGAILLLPALASLLLKPQQP